MENQDMAGYKPVGPPETAAHERKTSHANQPNRPHAHHHAVGRHNKKKKNRSMTMKQLTSVLAQYPNAELVWVQDEPENQGAWPFIALEVADKLGGRSIRRISRASAASTATGSPKVHANEHAAIMKEALAR